MQRNNALIEKFNTTFKSSTTLPKERDINILSKMSKDEIARFILNDYFLSFTVLKQANQVYPGQVSSVSSAVNRLGPKSIFNNFLSEHTEPKKLLFTIPTLRLFNLRKVSLRQHSVTL
jgi:HD-like signal output (HDOD) protein